MNVIFPAVESSLSAAQLASGKSITVQDGRCPDVAHPQRNITLLNKIFFFFFFTCVNEFHIVGNKNQVS